MTTATDAATAAADAVDDVIEQTPLGYILGVGAAALAVAWLVRRIGERLPAPAPAAATDGYAEYAAPPADPTGDDQVPDDDVPDDQYAHVVAPAYRDQGEF